MSYVYDIANYLDIESLGRISEFLLVTICISTIFFYVRKINIFLTFQQHPSLILFP